MNTEFLLCLFHGLEKGFRATGSVAEADELRRLYRALKGLKGLSLAELAVRIEQGGANPGSPSKDPTKPDPVKVAQAIGAIEFLGQRAESATVTEAEIKRELQEVFRDLSPTDAREIARHTAVEQRSRKAIRENLAEQLAERVRRAVTKERLGMTGTQSPSTNSTFIRPEPPTTDTDG